MKLSLIIPIYNEAAHLERFLTAIDALELPLPKELILVDDASRDESAAIVERFAFRSEHMFLRAPHNQGKGAALRRGIEAATGDIIGIQDADFEYHFDDIPALIDPLLKGRADVVYGSRFKAGNPQVHRTFHYLVNRFLTMVSNLFSGLYLSDMETCYKFFRADIIKNIRLESDRFGFEPEVTAKIAKLKVRVFEVPISYFPRNYLEGKKITWRDGIAALGHLFVYNFRRSRADSLKPDMPKAYVPSGRQLL